MQVHVSPRHKMLGMQDSPAIRQLFPSAREITLGGSPHLFVPHGLTETFLLRKLGYQVPSPILSHYDWAGALSPFEAQRKTAAMLTMNQRSYVLNDKGTGKTKTALWAWDYLRANSFCGKMLVVAPLSTLARTWVREVIGTLPHRKCVVLHGSKAKRLERLASEEAEIFIINHDGIGTINEQLKARSDIDVLVIDELAIFRNGAPDRTKLMIKLAERMAWVWGMTGDPIPHSPTDVWAQAKIVTPASVPKYFGRFREDLMTKAPGDLYKWLPKNDAVDRAFAVMQPSVRFTLSDVVELPPYVERFVDVELGPKQEKVYKDVKAKCFSAIQNKEIVGVNAGAALNKLLQISLGWVYASDKSVIALDNDLRVKTLLDELAGAARKVIVFVPYKHALEGISAALTKEGIEHACMSGDTEPKERDEILALFSSTSKYKVLVAHPQCISHGVDGLQNTADTIIWFAPITNNDIYNQANARIRRVGQKHKQLFLHFQSTAVERRVYKMLQAQQSIQEAFLELVEEATPAQEH